MFAFKLPLARAQLCPAILPSILVPEVVSLRDRFFGLVYSFYGGHTCGRCAKRRYCDPQRCFGVRAVGVPQVLNNGWVDLQSDMIGSPIV